MSKKTIKTKGHHRLAMSEDKQRELVDAYYASGESRPRFAQAHGVNYKTFSNWIKKYGISGSWKPSSSMQPESTVPKFAQFSIENKAVPEVTCWDWELRLGDKSTLRIGANVDIASVIKLVRALNRG